MEVRYSLLVYATIYLNFWNNKKFNCKSEQQSEKYMEIKKHVLYLGVHCGNVYVYTESLLLSLCNS